MLKLPTFMKPKRQLNLLIAGMFLVLQMPLFLAVPAVSAAPKDDEPKKAAICKYVGTPGVNETLQTGNNPIVVDRKDTMQVGTYFQDGQGRSYILGFLNPTDPEPSVSACPPPASTVIAIPTVPVIDPCGLGNAVFGTVPAGNYSVALNLNGSITLTAAQGFTFTGNLTTVTLPAPIDSGLLCLPSQIAIPTVPVIDPCGLGNAVFGTVPAGNYSVALNLNGSITLTAAQGFVFTGAQATVTLPAPLDSGVLCLPAAPSAIATTEECSLEDENVGEVSVAVTNTDDNTNQAVEYTVTLGGQVKKITLADGITGSLTFTGLDVGNYTAVVVGNDGTSTTSSAEVNECTVKVTLCHATGSESNTYVKITISAAGAFNGHLDNDFGGTHGDHQNGEDIIPPFEFKGISYEQNWDEAGQIIYRNNCVVPETEEPETEAPTATATIIPCVFGSGFNDIVSVNVTNTDDDTNETVEYTVQLGGQVKTITLEDGESGSVNFSGVSAGTVMASVTGDDETGTTTNEVTVSTCEDEGDILGEVIPTGGQGAAVVTPAPSVLADTGKDFTASLFAALAIIGATCALAITSRRARFNQ